MLNITITNNIIEGREPGTVRLRMFDVNVHNGDKRPTDIAFDIAPGEEHRVNLINDTTGFEVRPVIEGTAFASDEKLTPDLLGIRDAYQALKQAVRRVPAIRADMTLPEADRDAKAAAAWAEALRLAQS